MIYNYLTDQFVYKPSYHLMKRAYEDYKIDSKPCKRGVSNQCAIRMSIALERCGVTLDAINSMTVHRSYRRCIVEIPHIAESQTLANYLKELWGVPKTFNEQRTDEARNHLHNRRGVIFFQNCFTRDGQTEKRGDHIDLWNGGQYYNQIFRAAAGGNAGRHANLFDLADEIWFFQLVA